MLFSGPAVLANDCPIQLGDSVLVTSLGQNLDALIIKTILDEIKVKTDFLPVAPSSVLADYEQVIVSPGISYKGIAAAGMTVYDELARARDLVEAASEYSTQVILMYLGGFLQGDAKSQELIEILAPQADIIIVYKDCGGPLEYFRRVAEKNEIPILTIENLGNLATELSCMFSR
jgi:hypothetical protein